MIFRLQTEDVKDYAMPFHPRCFDLYLRASKCYLGHVDINGLMRWYNIESDWDAVYSFPRDPDVTRSSEQWWEHLDGMEYLAANPLLIPGLAPILRSAIHMEASFTAEAGAFEVAKTVPDSDSSDPFITLPQELKFSILRFLHSRDIANLRFVSRAYRQLPIYVFRHLLEEEMPFLWEVWNDDDPYFWATVSPEGLKEDAAAREKIREEGESIRAVITRDLPELNDTITEAVQEILDARPDPIMYHYTKALEKVVCGLPRENTNWYEVYVGIARANLKGLRNRKRIWKDLEEIITRIKKYRDEGRIVD